VEEVLVSSNEEGDNEENDNCDDSLEANIVYDLQIITRVIVGL
jgi:hypothetical protein